MGRPAVGGAWWDDLEAGIGGRWSRIMSCF